MGLLDAGQCTLWWARVCDCPLGRLGRIIGAEMGYEVGQDFSTTRLGTVVPAQLRDGAVVSGLKTLVVCAVFKAYDGIQNGLGIECGEGD